MVAMDDNSTLLTQINALLDAHALLDQHMFTSMNNALIAQDLRFDQRFELQQQSLQQRFDAQQQALRDALAAQKEAAEKTERSQERAVESMRTESAAMIHGVNEKIDMLMGALHESQGSASGKDTGRNNWFAYIGWTVGLIVAAFATAKEVFVFK